MEKLILPTTVLRFLSSRLWLWLGWEGYLWSPHFLITWKDVPMFHQWCTSHRYPTNTLPETNSSHLKIGQDPTGISSSNHPFSGANLLLVSGKGSIDQPLKLFASQGHSRFALRDSFDPSWERSWWRPHIQRGPLKPHVPMRFEGFIIKSPRDVASDVAWGEK